MSAGADEAGLWRACSGGGLQCRWCSVGVSQFRRAGAQTPADRLGALQCWCGAEPSLRVCAARARASMVQGCRAVRGDGRPAVGGAAMVQVRSRCRGVARWWGAGVVVQRFVVAVRRRADGRCLSVAGVGALQAFCRCSGGASACSRRAVAVWIAGASVVVVHERAHHRRARRWASGVSTPRRVHFLWAMAIRPSRLQMSDALLNWTVKTLVCVLSANFVGWLRLGGLGWKGLRVDGDVDCWVCCLGS